MSEPTCFYHPSRQADNKCERCNRLICLNDTNRVKERKSAGTGDSRSYYMEEYIFCSLCNFDYVQEKKQQAQAFRIIVPVVLGMFFFIVFIMVSNFNNQVPSDPRINSDPFGTSDPFNDPSSNPSPMSIFGPILIIGAIMMFGIFFVISQSSKSKVEDMETKASQQKAEFLDSVENMQFLKKYGREEILTCNQCGSGIPADSSFCMDCGDSTKDEKLMSKM